MGGIELTEDEAYQWLWSKHPALSYYSKPPMIAYAQWLGTHLWGDNEFGVRFFSPVIAAMMSLLVLRFMAREAGARVAFLLFLVIDGHAAAGAGRDGHDGGPAFRIVLDGGHGRRMARRAARREQRANGCGSACGWAWDV